MSARTTALAAALLAPLGLIAAAPADAAADRITVTAHVPPGDPGTLWHHEPVTVTLDVDAPAGILGPGSVRRVKVNTADPVETVLTNGTNEIVLGEGVNKVSWRATNPATFVTEASGSTEVDIDLTAPEVTITAGLPEGAVVPLGAQVAMRFSCSDALSGVLTCRTPDLDEQTATLDTTAPGDHVFVVTSADVAGNLATFTRHYTVVAPDTTPPVLSRSELTGQHGNDGWYLTPPTFRFSAVDPAVDDSVTSGVAAIDTDLDGTVTEVPGDVADVTVPSGRHVLKWASRDAAGNASSVGSLEVDVDLDPPLLAVSYPERDQHLATTDSAEPAFACADVTSGTRDCRLEVDGVERTTLDLAPGTHTAHFIAVDVAGRGTTTDVTYVVDPPVVQTPVGSTTTLSRVRASDTRRGTARVVVTSTRAPHGRVVVSDGTRRLVTVALPASTRAGRTTIVVRLPRLTVGRHVLRAAYLGASDVHASASRRVVVRVR